jgi:hypothetical protein
MSIGGNSKINLARRLSIPNNGLPDGVSNAAQAVATGITSQTESIASSAAAGVQSAESSVQGIIKNLVIGLSVGTQKACYGYGTETNKWSCSKLPFDILGQFNLSAISSNLSAISSITQFVTPSLTVIPLALSITSIIVADCLFVYINIGFFQARNWIAYPAIFASGLSFFLPLVPACFWFFLVQSAKNIPPNLSAKVTVGQVWSDAVILLCCAAILSSTMFVYVLCMRKVDAGPIANKSTEIHPVSASRN